MDKLWYIYLHNEIPLRNKEEQTTDTHTKMDKSQMFFAEWKKSDSIVWFHLYDVWKGQNYWDKNYISDCQELELAGIDY